MSEVAGLTGAAPVVAYCSSCSAELNATRRVRRAGRSLCVACARITRPPRSVWASAAAGVVSLWVAALLLSVVGAMNAQRQIDESLAHLRFAVEEFFLDLNRYPTEVEGLEGLLSADPDLDGRGIVGWRGPYVDLDRVGLSWSLERGGLLDARGRFLRYHATPDQRWVYVLAAGPNGVHETDEAGTLAFTGDPIGDDRIVWLEGP